MAYRYIQKMSYRKVVSSTVTIEPRLNYDEGVIAWRTDRLECGHDVKHWDSEKSSTRMHCVPCHEARLKREQRQLAARMKTQIAIKLQQHALS